MGSFRHPGSGFLPFGLSLILIILSLILIATRLGGRKEPTPFWPEHTWLRPLLGIIILFAYAASIGKFGFLITTLLFLFFWMGIIERLRWFKVVTISVVVTAALYIIFGKLLEVPLPVGFLKF